MALAYYNNLSHGQKTLLTTATKSVIAWHLVFTILTYCHMIASAIFKDVMKGKSINEQFISSQLSKNVFNLKFILNQ